MGDIWSFLLQTLTVSGAAVLVLLVKRMFRATLSPRWQWAMWGIPALALVLPAGRGGRYVLVNWPLAVETLKSLVTGEFDALTRVGIPLPLPPRSLPERPADWLFALYFLGAAALLLHYILSYLRLRRSLRRGTPVPPEVRARLEDTAARYGLKTCPAVAVPGLRTAFVCGVLRPVLALPEEAQADEAVLLHELLHLRHRDAAWGLLLCLVRCVHWCNPLVWYCADQAGNDLESLCDQRVLERLEGEERRAYGRILLSMADERYAHAPGTSSVANGGRNIRRRVEAIARFRRYPAGMTLASVCVALVIAAPVILGTASDQVYDDPRSPAWGVAAAMASARTVPCTTAAGAMDAYGKAVLTGRVVYRAMCAPEEELNGLAVRMRDHLSGHPWEQWDAGLPVYAQIQRGYAVYNLTGSDETGYEGLLAVELSRAPEDAPAAPEHYAHCYLAVQTIRAEEREGRWIVTPLEPFRTVLALGYNDLPNLNCTQLPARIYEAEAGDFTLRLRRQTRASISDYLYQGPDIFHQPPDPDGVFDVAQGVELWAVYTGEEADKADYTSIGAALAPLNRDGSRPDLGPSDPSIQMPGVTDGGGSSTSGDSWGVKSLEGDWDREIFLSGGGAGGFREAEQPDGFAADLYLNGRLAAQLTLLPAEGGEADG